MNIINLTRTSEHINNCINSYDRTQIHEDTFTYSCLSSHNVTKVLNNGRGRVKVVAISVVTDVAIQITVFAV